MDHRVLLASLMLALCVGCGGAGTHDKLVGTWALDAQATRELPDFRNMPEDEREGLFEALAGMTLEMTFTKGTLRQSMHAKATGGQLDESGSYKVVKRDGTKLVLVLTTQDGERKRIGVDVQGDRLILDMDNARSVLVRK